MVGDAEQRVEAVEDSVLLKQEVMLLLAYLSPNMLSATLCPVSTINSMCVCVGGGAYFDLDLSSAFQSERRVPQ